MHDGPAALQAGDEIRLLIEPGGCFEVPGSADSVAMRQQLAAALAASVLLEGGLVLITDWLPGLQWRIQVSQRFADLLPGLTVDAIWSAVEPHLARWLERPADADVFVVSPKWGECALVPSAYRCGWKFVAFTSMPLEYFARHEAAERAAAHRSRRAVSVPS